MSIKELSTDDLLNIASSGGGKTVGNLANDTSNIKDFLLDVEIKDGLTLVPTYVIYYHYCKVWRHTGQKISKIGFFRKINKLFETKRTKKIRYYLLDSGKLELDKESLKLAKDFDLRYEKRIKKNIVLKKLNKGI